MNSVEGCSADAESTFECIKASSTESLLAALENNTILHNELLPWVPVIDGPYGIFPDLPSRLFAEGRIPRLPFIAGAILDDGEHGRV